MIELTRVCKTYQRGDGTPVAAAHDISIRVERGEFVALRGPSGSGKSSVLNIIGCLDQPTSGAYSLDGEQLSGFSDRQLSGIRARAIGFVFQSFNLLPRTTAVENIELPMIYSAGRVDHGKAMAALDHVGLAERAHHYGTELSGGEQQRVAIARALINDPPIILADEPTGNLDSKAGTEIMEILRQLHEEGRTIFLVTHDDAIARYAFREIVLKDGRIDSDRTRQTDQAATVPVIGGIK
jgi:putative ABC transport system ATP-binding protein